jgi:hypothetical protein
MTNRRRPDEHGGRRPGHSRRLYAAIVVLLAAASLSLHLIGVTLPWRGPLDSAGAWYSHNADFLLAHGPSVTKLALVSSAGAVAPADIQFRNTHPPLIVAWLALFRGVLGTGEWTSRLAAIALSLVLLLFTYLTARRITDEKTSLLVFAVAVLMPMEAYWGRLPSESLAASSMTAGAVYWYVSYRIAGGRTNAVLFFVFHFLACQADWIAYPLPAALFLFEIATRNRRLGIPSVAIGLNFLYFGLFLLQSYWASGDPHFTALFSSAAPWLVTGPSGALSGMGTVVSRIGIYFSLPLCLAAAAWLVVFMRSVTGRGASADPMDRYRTGVPAIFLFVFIFYSIAFPRLVTVHEILLHPLSPFFPLAFGIVASRTARFLERPAVAGLIVALMVTQLVLVLGLRYSHQDGYPVDYPVSRRIGSVTDSREHVITHVTLGSRYYQFYCDRDMLMGVNSIPAFITEASSGRYTTFLAVDRDALLSSEPGIKEDAAFFVDYNHLEIDPALLALLRENYPCRRESYFLKFDLTKKGEP